MIKDIWGSISREHPLSRTHLHHQSRIPSSRGTILIEQGLLEQFDLTATHLREVEAMRYARYAYPSAKNTGNFYQL